MVTLKDMGDVAESSGDRPQSIEFAPRPAAAPAQ
jgi:hypothetical protein